MQISSACLAVSQMYPRASLRCCLRSHPTQTQCSCVVGVLIVVMACGGCGGCCWVWAVQALVLLSSPVWVSPLSRLFFFGFRLSAFGFRLNALAFGFGLGFGFGPERPLEGPLRAGQQPRAVCSAERPYRLSLALVQVSCAQDRQGKPQHNASQTVTGHLQASMPLAICAPVAAADSHS